MAGWGHFRDETLPGVLAEASRLSGKADPVTQPYKSKYEAAEQLAKAKEQVAGQAGSGQEAQEVESVLSVARGLVLLETDLQAEAEQCLAQAMELLDQQSKRFAALLQQVATATAGASSSSAAQQLQRRCATASCAVDTQ